MVDALIFNGRHDNIQAVKGGDSIENKFHSQTDNKITADFFSLFHVSFVFGHLF